MLLNGVAVTRQATFSHIIFIIELNTTLLVVCINVHDRLMEMWAYVCERPYLSWSCDGYVCFTSACLFASTFVFTILLRVPPVSGFLYVH